MSHGLILSVGNHLVFDVVTTGSIPSIMLKSNFGQEYTITNLFTNERLQDIAWFGSDDPGKKEYNYNKIGAGTKYRCAD